MSQELLPCPLPWCNKTNRQSVLGRPGLYVVMCGCGTNGPESPSRDEAIAAWNRRTPDASRESKEAMDAGYAQGVEVTEAKASKRIAQLESDKDFYEWWKNCEKGALDSTFNNMKALYEENQKLKASRELEIVKHGLKCRQEAEAEAHRLYHESMDKLRVEAENIHDPEAQPGDMMRRMIARAENAEAALAEMKASREAEQHEALVKEQHRGDYWQNRFDDAREKVRKIQQHIEAGGANPELTAATILCTDIIMGHGVTAPAQKPEPLCPKCGWGEMDHIGGVCLDVVKVKCNGNHGGKNCADPECWQREPKPEGVKCPPGPHEEHPGCTSSWCPKCESFTGWGVCVRCPKCGHPGPKPEGGAR